MLGRTKAASRRRILHLATFAPVLACFSLLTLHPAETMAAPKNCAAKPSKCGYPDLTNTGVQKKVKASLKKVPGQVRSGPGWRWTGGRVEITQDGTVFSGYEVDGTIDVLGDDVLIKNVHVIQGGETFGIAIRRADNTRIQHCKVGPGPGDSRLMVGIKDIYGNADNIRIFRCEIYGTATGIQIPQGVIQRNYIHDIRYRSGDHLNGITTNGGQKLLRILTNTIFNEHSQTDAIGLFPDFAVEANRVVRNNLLAGGGYTLYAGKKSGKPDPYNIKIIGNRFSRHLFSKSGYYGPATAYHRSGKGNKWEDNVWDDTNQPVSAP